MPAIVALFGFWASIALVVFSAIIAMAKASGSRRSDGSFAVEPKGVGGLLIAPFAAALIIAITSTGIFFDGIRVGEPAAAAAANQLPHLVEQVSQSTILSIIVVVAIVAWFWALVASLNARRQWKQRQGRN